MLISIVFFCAHFSLHYFDILFFFSVKIEKKKTLQKLIRLSRLEYVAHACSHDGNRDFELTNSLSELSMNNTSSSSQIFESKMANTTVSENNYLFITLLQSYFFLKFSRTINQIRNGIDISGE